MDAHLSVRAFWRQQRAPPTNHARPTPGGDLRHLLALLLSQALLLTFLCAAAVTWTGRNSWAFTRHITWPKAVLLTGLLGTAIAVLLTQEFNPFIYFIF